MRLRYDQDPMAAQLRALYYPECSPGYETLIKEILLFDELHFMDRPSISFHTTGGQFGSIGLDSPLRKIEAELRAQGLPIYVHEPYSGPIPPDAYEKVKADIGDSNYLKEFQNGLKNSETFRNMMIQRGNYGNGKTEVDVLNAYLSVNIEDLENRGGGIKALESPNVRPMDLSTEQGIEKSMCLTAAICSAKTNFALQISAEEDFAPLADARPFGKMLSTKYGRAIRAMGNQNLIPISDLSFSVLDELLSKEALANISIEDALKYRKASDGPRKEFMQHLNLLRSQYGALPGDADFEAEIYKLIAREIIPAAIEFKKSLQRINASLVVKFQKGILGAAAGAPIVSIFSGLDLQKILGLAAMGLAFSGNAWIDYRNEIRTTERECALSYVLALD